MALKHRFRELILKVNFGEGEVEEKMIRAIERRMSETATEIRSVQGVDIDFTNRMFTTTFDQEVSHEH